MIDIGTGDGRFVSAAARANPHKFYIGVDANAKPLEKPSMRATRKQAKGGLANAMFVQAAVEDLPEEFAGIAAEIHVHFPWGSLLRAVSVGDAAVLGSLRRIATHDCQLEIMIGVDPDRDRTELERLGLPELSENYFRETLIPKYEGAGCGLVSFRELGRAEWSRIETSWARKLSGNDSRRVFDVVFSAI